jgi:hypothetical protein
MQGVSSSLSGLKAAKSVPVKRLGFIVCMSNKIVFYPRFSVPGLLLEGVVKAATIPKQWQQSGTKSADAFGNASDEFGQR